MSTRSDIIVECQYGTWARIYCHWDGYLSHNGQILFEHYTTQEKVEALVALGDLSVLKPEIGEKHPFDAPPMFASLKAKTPSKAYREYQRKYGNWCLAYGRDRGEKGTEVKIGKSLEEVWPTGDSWTEFTYVWKIGNDTGKWWVGDADAGPDGLKLLEDALKGDVEVTPPVKIFGGAVIGKHKPIGASE